MVPRWLTSGLLTSSRTGCGWLTAEAELSGRVIAVVPPVAANDCGLMLICTVAGVTPLDGEMFTPPLFEVSTKSVFVPVIHWTASSFSQWTWPDPTFHGLLPSMQSNSQFLSIFGIQESGWQQDVTLDWTNN